MADRHFDECPALLERTSIENHIGIHANPYSEVKNELSFA
jgi:hypothetical protein